MHNCHLPPFPTTNTHSPPIPMVSYTDRSKTFTKEDNNNATGALLLKGLGVCHGWLNLHALARAAMNTKQARDIKRKILAHIGSRTPHLPLTKQTRYQLRHEIQYRQLSAYYMCYLPVQRRRHSKYVILYCRHIIF